MWYRNKGQQWPDLRNKGAKKHWHEWNTIIFWENLLKYILKPGIMDCDQSEGLSRAVWSSLTRSRVIYMTNARTQPHDQTLEMIGYVSLQLLKEELKISISDSSYLSFWQTKRLKAFSAPRKLSSSRISTALIQLGLKSRAIYKIKHNTISPGQN